MMKRRLAIGVGIAAFFLVLTGGLRPVGAEELPRERWPETLQPARVESLLNEALHKVQAQPGSIEAHLRVAQLGFYAWRLEKTDNRKRLRIAFRVLEAGEKLLKLDSDHPGGWHWVGAGYGMIGLTKGVLNSLQLVPKIKAPMEKSIALDAGWLHASALAQLSRLYTMIPGFPLSIGDAALAEKYAREAISLDPQFALQRLYLADLLWYQGRVREALAELDAFEKLQPVDELSWFSYEVSKPKAAELRERILKGEKRDRFYDVLSDIQPGLVN